MKWEICFSRQSTKFLNVNRINEKEILELIKNAIAKFKGEDINVDIKKLHGNWSNFHRIRKGKLRIIAEFDFDNHSVLIEIIDWRGNSYK